MLAPLSPLLLREHLLVQPPVMAILTQGPGVARTEKGLSEAVSTHGPEKTQDPA